MLIRTVASSLASIILMASCTSFKPATSPDLTPRTPTGWSSYIGEPVLADHAAQLPAWVRANDPILNDLTTLALAANPDIALAASRVREARALLQADIAGQGPQIGLNGSIAAQRQTETGAFPVDRIPGYDKEFLLYDAHFDALWELDLYGRKQVRQDIATARLASEQERLSDVRTSLMAELARAYMEYRGAQTEQALLDAIIERQVSLLDAQRFRRDQGEASDLDVMRARAQLTEFEARRPVLLAAQRTTLYRIARLCGQDAAQIEPSLLETGKLPDMDMSVTPGLPSDVLRQRADVRAAERAYVMAARNSDLARLDLYPSVSLFGAVGPSTISLGDLFDPASLAINLGAMVDWTVLDGGRKQAMAQASDEGRIQAELAYRRTVLDALNEVETRFAQYLETQHELALRERNVANRQAIADMARERFAGGTGTLIEVLETERDAGDAEIATTRLRTQVNVQLIALEKALGMSPIDRAQ